MRRSKDDVTVEWIGQTPTAIMRWEGLEFHEPLDPIIFEFSPEKQKYWFRKALVKLEKKFQEATKYRVISI